MERRYGQVEGKEKIRYGLTVSQGIQTLSREKKHERVFRTGVTPRRNGKIVTKRWIPAFLYYNVTYALMQSSTDSSGFLHFDSVAAR